jgi:CDP-diacylglycerol--glycerol-3-phosphate 3-phosphatidyltransferase
MRIPTQLTVLRIVLVPVFFVLMALSEPPQVGWATVVFLVAAVSDWWDGYMARMMNQTSTLGAFLDPLADKLLTSAAFIAFAWLEYIPWWMVVIVIARDIYLTLLRMAADADSVQVKTSNFAKVKTFAQMTYIVLVLAALLAKQSFFGVSLQNYGVGFFQGELQWWLMSLVTLLTFTSALAYSYDNWGVLRGAISRYLLRRPGQESA